MKSNNMGGIIRIEYITIDQIYSFDWWGVNLCQVVLREQAVWSTLPVSLSNSSVKAQHDQSNGIYTHSATLVIPNCKMSDNTQAELERIIRTGCIIRTVTPSGTVRIYGSLDYPMVGNFADDPGSKATDLSAVRLNLSSKQIHPQLVPLS